MNILTRAVASLVVGALLIAFIWWIGAPRVWAGFMNMVGSLFTIAIAVLIILWALATLIRAATRMFDWLCARSHREHS